MESLYVCLFSNGQTKVGRSIDPASRIAAHVSRVACMGVELSDYRTYACIDENGRGREADLIERCASFGAERFLDEWFVGLDFEAVCGWAKQAAEAVLPSATEPPTRWAGLLRDLKRAGVTQMEIAKRCCCAQPSISDLATGRTKEPVWSIGDALIQLHAERCHIGA